MSVTLKKQQKTVTKNLNKQTHHTLKGIILYMGDNLHLLWFGLTIILRCKYICMCSCVTSQQLFFLPENECLA